MTETEKSAKSSTLWKIGKIITTLATILLFIYLIFGWGIPFYQIMINGISPETAVNSTGDLSFYSLLGAIILGIVGMVTRYVAD